MNYQGVITIEEGKRGAGRAFVACASPWVMCLVGSQPVFRTNRF